MQFDLNCAFLTAFSSVLQWILHSRKPVFRLNNSKDKKPDQHVCWDNTAYKMTAVYEKMSAMLHTTFTTWSQCHRIRPFLSPSSRSLGTIPPKRLDCGLIKCQVVFCFLICLLFVFVFLLHSWDMFICLTKWPQNVLSLPVMALFRRF